MHLIPDTALPRFQQGWDLLMASQLKGEDNYVISVIGDGSLTGGMAWEALNNASRLKQNFIIVLNDNNMSIAENVGGMSRIFESDTDKGRIPESESWCREHAVTFTGTWRTVDSWNSENKEQH